MPASVVVADSWAILAYFQREGAAWEIVRRHLRRVRSGSLRMLMNVVNLGEVFYRTAQLRDEATAEVRIAELRHVPIEVVPAREPLVLEAARIKAAHAVSYADAFAIATARQEGCRLLTGDPEILRLPASVVRVVPLAR